MVLLFTIIGGIGGLISCAYVVKYFKECRWYQLNGAHVPEPELPFMGVLSIIVLILSIIVLFADYLYFGLR